MKKATLILAVIALMFSTNIFAQENTSTKVEKITREVLKAYKTQDVELLKKNASGIIKMSISKSYFEDKDVKEYIRVINDWDGKIRGIGYETQHIGPMTIYMATVYFADAPKDYIYVVTLSRTDKGKQWVMFAKGLDKIKKEEFNSLDKSLSLNTTNTNTKPKR